MEAHKRISALQLPGEVEIKAKEIYDSLPTEIRKKKKLAKIIYLSVSEAYRACGRLYDHKALRETLNVKKTNDILKQAGRHGYKPVLHHYGPEYWFREYTHLLGIDISGHRPEIQEILDLTLEKYPTLNEKNPRAVSAAVVLFFARINGYLMKDDEIDTTAIAEFIAEVGISEDLITTMQNAVSEAHK